jgi:CsoR family transcriptional regulator, copper-sensing transcriptional repressor
MPRRQVSAQTAKSSVPGPGVASPSPEPGGQGNPGYAGHEDEVLARLRRIEGQIRGLQRMVIEDTYCIDVLTQISSATRALQAVSVALLSDHMHHCVSDAVAAGGPAGAARVDEAMKAVERLVRS